MDSTIGKTLEHIALLAKHLDKSDLRGALIVIFMELGVPTNNIGFEILLRTVLLQRKNPARALTNDIYQEIRLHCRQVSAEQVEQSIRDAIQAAWDNGSDEAWEWYFSYAGQPVTAKPTNREFISQIVYILDLWQAYTGKEVSHER